ncbi:MAG: hypothetical protein QY318_02075 [Candidatus Dojkabacteria bacterium]|nr:MAG: hypothetical protein QY318_02075 [Candidatus Dojkabacteria bacterium]
MVSNIVPDNWVEQIEKYTYERTGQARKTLEATDFDANSTVEVLFPDDSTMKLRYAFYIKNELLGEIGIFTEHCGYFFYKSEDLKVSNVRSED